MGLTADKIKKLQPKTYPYMRADRDGLCLEILPSGNKSWKFQMMKDGKRSKISIGKYPEVSIEDAREKALELRRKTLNNEDITAKQDAVNGGEALTFGALTTEWLAVHGGRFVPSYRRTIDLRLNRYILPKFAKMPVKDITTAMIVALCREPTDEGKHETASRIRKVIGQVIRYGIDTAQCTADPTALMGRNALQRPKKKHLSCIKTENEAQLLIRASQNYPYELTRYALLFSALTFCRPGEIRQAEWAEIDWGMKLWKIPPHKMKMREPHVVPLCSQALGVLQKLQLITGNEKWLFPSMRGAGRCMSENTVRLALRAIGYDKKTMTAHGFRGMASTILNESGQFRREWVDIQLSHKGKTEVEASYNHAKYLAPRTQMMQWYGDLLFDVARALFT